MSVEDVIARQEQIAREGEALLAERQSKALKIAWQRRQQLKVLRAALKAREIDGLDLIAGKVDPRIEKVVSEVRLKSLLPMIPGLGQSSAHEVLGAARLSGSRKLGELSMEKRRELVFIIKGARGAHAL